MSIRDAYEHCLIELNKVLAPSLLLDDFVYLFNKAVQQYVNLRYNLFEINQLLTDDLRVLLRHIELVKDYNNSENDLLPDLPTVKLPIDYLHMLNCQIEFTEVSDNKCRNGKTFIKGVNKVDTNQWSHLVNNYYMLPSVKLPYYYIMNTVDYDADASHRDSNFTSGNRYGNSVQPVLDIKYGNSSDYKVNKVMIDYLRSPRYYSLDASHLDSFTDLTTILEFPDYVIYEIINTLVKIILENGTNPRLLTHIVANSSIPQTIDKR